MGMKPIRVKNIALIEFKELLEKIEAKILKENIDLYYNEYIIKDKLIYLKYYKPTREYIFCDSGLLGFVGINFIDYKTILENKNEK